jgi:hypothetical protein
MGGYLIMGFYDRDETYEEVKRLTRVLDKDTCPKCFSKYVLCKDFSEVGHSCIEDGPSRRRVCGDCGKVFGEWFW